MTRIEPREVEDLRARAEEDPFGVLEQLRGDTDLMVAYARADTLPFLQEWFTEDEAGWQVDLERSGPLGPASAGIEWSFHGVHDRESTLNGLAASFRPVDVRGFSIFGVERNRFQVRRYVDWAGLFAQLHLSLNWRMPVSKE